jgi:hypothetical protein
MPDHETELRLLLPGPPPTADEVERRIRLEHPCERHESGGAWALVSTDPAHRWVLQPVTTEPAGNLHIASHGLEEADVNAIARSMWSLAIRGAITEGEATESFERLLLLARAAAPDAVALVDADGGAVRPAGWLKEVAITGVPVRLDALYRIHAVTADDGTCWLHTHGLARCGVPELELHAVPQDDVHAAGALLQTAAHRALVHGVPAMGRSVEYGHGLSAALVPWRYAWPTMGTELGGPADRGEHHPEANLILAVWTPTGPDSGVWRSAAAQLADVGENPVFFLTHYETDRMEALARLRWRSFAMLAAPLAGVDGWRFLAKFGYGGEDTSREHLWFEVDAADPHGASATLLNDPFQDLGMRAGDRGRHDISNLTDFVVASPFGTANPESIDRLMRRWLAEVDASSQN